MNSVVIYMIMIFLLASIDLKSESFWEKVAFNVPDTINAIVFDKNDNIYLGTKKAGIYSSTDRGYSWVRHINGLTTKYILDIKINQNDDIFALEWPNGIVRSTDKGENWNRINEGISLVNGYIPAFSISIANNNDLFVSISNDQIYHSIDNGDNWNEITSGSILNKRRNCYLKYNNGFLFVNPIYNNFFGLFRTADNGKSWVKLLDENKYSVICIAINQISDIICTINENGIYHSSDNGDNFKLIYNGLDTNRFSEIIINKYNHIYALSPYKALIRSIDNGETWVKLDSNFYDKDISCLAFSNDNYLYAGTKGQGLYRSKMPLEIFTFSTKISPSDTSIIVSQDSINFDIAITDTKYGSKLKNAQIIVYDSINNKVDSIYSDSLGKSNYICRIPNNITNGKYPIKFIISMFGYANIDTVTSIIDINLTDVRDNNNYIYFQSSPNPFSESTTIKYSIPYPSHVKLSIYDIYGREVAVLVEGWQDIGEHIYHLPFTIYHLSDGIYFCKLQAGGETKVIKILKIE